MRIWSARVKRGCAGSEEYTEKREDAEEKHEVEGQVRSSNAPNEENEAKAHNVVVTVLRYSYKRIWHQVIGRDQG